MCSPERTKLDDFAYKLPPTPRVGLVRPRHERRCIVQLSFFFLRRSFFARGSCSGVRRGERRAADAAAPTNTNEVDRTNILAPGFILLPAFTPEAFRGLAQWEVVSSYSSATAPDSHGISCADPLFQARKELNRGLATCAQPVKIYLINRSTQPCGLV